MIIGALAVIIGFVLLIKGADMFVAGASGIASKFGIPQIVIGLTIVAMGTSAPEAAVSITSALNNSADLTIGNVLGSNILNILIILGTTAVITPIAVQKNTVRIEIPFMIVVSVILVLSGFDGIISLLDALILCVLFIMYLSYLFYTTKKEKEETEAEEKSKQDAEKRKPVTLVMILLIGVAAIIFGSKFVVNGATSIAEILGVSERLIGLTVVALGTSLPELVTGITAAKKGCADIAIGNIVGSNIFNILFVIGITSLIIPVPYQQIFTIDSIIMVASEILLLLAVIKSNKVSRAAGIVMLLSYIGYFIYLL